MQLFLVKQHAKNKAKNEDKRQRTNNEELLQRTNKELKKFVLKGFSTKRFILAGGGPHADTTLTAERGGVLTHT